MAAELWAELRDHPNATFLATDYEQAVAPYWQDAQQPCGGCSYSCKRCLPQPSGLAEEVRRLGQPRGLAPRVTSKTAYRDILSSSTFCLVLRGDNENTRKFTEVRPSPGLASPPIAEAESYA